MTRPDAHLYALGLNEEFDDVDLIEGLEQSFGLTFPRPIPWTTAGDVHEAVLAALPSSDSQGKCAVLMAFHRLRRALRTVLRTQARIVPQTRFRDLTRRSAASVERALAVEMGLPRRSLSLSWIGGFGLLGLFFGLIAAPVSLFAHRFWRAIGLFPLGLLMIRLDPGVFEYPTVGRLARALAAENYGVFIRDGAETRPETVWIVLCKLLGRLSEVPSSLIRPDTRLASSRRTPAPARSRPGRRSSLR